MRLRDPRLPLFALAPSLAALGLTLSVPARAVLGPILAASPVALAATDGPAATMVGFRKTGENSALVYVQLTASTSVVSSESGKTLTFTLKGTLVPKQNNLNPLVATHFDSLVDSARLVPSKGDTNLVIVLRREARASAQVVKLGDGAVLEVHLTGEAKAPAKSPAR